MRLLSLVPLVFVAACVPPVNTPADPQIPALETSPAGPAGVGQPAEGAEADDPQLTGRTWTWVRTEEPATGEVMAPTEGAAEHVFTFTDDGRFVEDQLGGCCREEGDWSMEADVLSLAYDNGGDATWTDVTITAERLTWKRIGRHGELLSVYRPRG